MPTDHTGPALQVRVYIGPGSPLHGILSALPAASRAAALVRLAEAHTPEAATDRTDRLAVATERLAAETARVAQALQALAVGPVATVPPATETSAPAAAPTAPTKMQRLLAATDEDRWG